MTGEELDKASTFLLNQQAQLVTTVDRLAAKVDRTADGISALQVAELHDREIKETDDRLNALINTVERHTSEGHGGNGRGGRQ